MIHVGKCDARMCDVGVCDVVMVEVGKLISRCLMLVCLMLIRSVVVCVMFGCGMLGRLMLAGHFEHLGGALGVAQSWKCRQFRTLSTSELCLKWRRAGNGDSSSFGNTSDFAKTSRGHRGHDATEA